MALYISFPQFFYEYAQKFQQEKVAPYLDFRFSKAHKMELDFFLLTINCLKVIEIFHDKDNYHFFPYSCKTFGANSVHILLGESTVSITGATYLYIKDT